MINVRKMFCALAAFCATFAIFAANVAKIGDTEYSTIGAAINAAGEGDTVVLLSNVDVSGYFVYNKNYTIDGNGYTIRCVSPNSNYPNYFVNVNGYSQTFKNVTIDANEKVPYAMQCIENGSVLTLDNVTVKGGKSMKTKGKNDSYSKSRLGYGIHINNGSVVAKDLKVSNCTVLPVYLDGSSSKFNLSGDNCSLDVVGTSGSVAEFATTARGYCAYEVQASYKFMGFINQTKTCYVISAMPWNKVVDQVGNFSDITVTSAIVKLLGNVTLVETFTSNDTKLTIDGNGKTVTGTIKFTSSPSSIKNVVLGDGSTLDFTGSTSHGFSNVSVAANTGINILLSSASDINAYSLPVSLGANAYALISVGDKKYIAKNGSIAPAESAAQVGETKYSTLQDAVNAANGAIIHLLKDVSLTSAVIVPAGTTVTLNLAGRIVTVSGANYAIVNNGNLTIVDEALVAVTAAEAPVSINDGSFYITCAASGIARSDSSTGCVVGVQNNGTFTLEGGKVASVSAEIPAIDNTASGTVSIAGGNVQGKLQSAVPEKLTVTGGTFSADSNVSDYLGGDQGLDSNGSVINYVACIGDAKYQTLEAAFGAAAEFDTVEVLDGEVDVSGVAGYVAEGLFPISNGDGTYTLRKKPDATVSKLPAFTLKAGSGDRWIYDGSGLSEDNVDRPLDIVMNFIANDDGKAQANATGFADWGCDFYLTLTGMSGERIVADGCYLAGNYGGWGWVVIPTDEAEIDNGAVVPVIGMIDDITYRQVCEDVKKFTAAIHVSDAILEANPGLKITLELKMTNDRDPEQELVVKSYTYTVDDLKGLSNPAVDVAEGVVVDDSFKKTVGNALAGAYQETDGNLEVTVVAKGQTFSTIDVAAKDGYEFPVEGLEMTFPAESVANGDTALIIHEHDGKKYVYSGIAEYGFVSFKNTLGFSEFTVGDQAALQVALAEGGEIVLLSDLELSKTVSVSKSSTIDGNGHAIVASPSFDEGSLCAFEVGNSGSQFGDLSLAVENATFSGFKTTYGVFRIEGATANFTGCVFDGNEQQNGNRGLINYAHGAGTISGCEFKNNVCAKVIDINSQISGAVSASEAFAVTGNKFVGNVCSGTAVVYYSTGTGCEISDNIFDSNSVTADAAAVVYLSGTASIDGNIFMNNTVVGIGDTSQKCGVVATGSSATGSAINGNAFTGNMVTSSTGNIVATAWIGSDNVNLSGNYWGDESEPEQGSGRDVYLSKDGLVLNDYYSSYAVDQNGNVVLDDANKVVLSVPAIAKIGDTGYPTLLAAFAAAKSGDTVSLLGDLTLQAGDIDYYQNIKIPAGVTFDGGNYELVVMESQDSDYAVIWSDGAYTVQNLSIKVMGRREANRSVFNFSKGGKISNVKIWAQVLDIGVNYDKPVDGMSLIVENCEISNVTYAFYCDPNASDIDVTIKNNVINSQRFGSMQHDERIEGNTLTATCTKGISLGASFTGTVTGNTFAGARALSVYGNQTISGNVFSSTSIVELNNGAVADLSGNYWGGEAPSESQIVADGATSVVSFTVDNYYTTYEEGVLGGLVTVDSSLVLTGSSLIDALEAGGEVKLGADIALKPSDANIEDDFYIYILLNNDVTLDLNGYTISCAVNMDYDDSYYYACIGGGAQLVITDSVGTGKISARAQQISFESIYTEEGWSDVPSITVQSGTVDSIALGNDATFGATGGNVTIYLYDEDYFYETSEYKEYIEGLVFTTDPTEYLPEGFKVVADSDGVYRFVEVKSVSGKVSYRAYVTNSDSRNAVQIDLENLYAKESVVVKLLDADDNVLTVTTLKAGGADAATFTVNAVLWGEPSSSWNTEIMQTLTVDNAPATIQLWLDGKLCDTFENAMGDKMNDYLAMGCIYKAAAIGTKYYGSLASAVAAAQEGDTVTLMSDIELDSTLTIAKSITIDGNGKKVIPADASTTYNSAFMVGDSGWGDDHGETIAINNVKFEGWKTNYGVVRAQGVTLNMDGCEFSGNSVNNAAYAVLSCNYTDALVTNTKFLGNNERSIDVNYNADGSKAVVTIDGCEFTENRTTGAGFIYKNAGNVIVKNSVFNKNTVSTTGNAAIVYTGWGTGAEITGCTFKDNTVVTSHTSTKRFASAIFCDGCIVKENAFIGNTATRNGETIATIVAVGAYYGAADISANYWGKAEPEAGVDFTVEYTRQDVAFDSYYNSIDEDGNLGNLVMFVAQIGDVKYTSFEAAAAAIPTDGSDTTIKLLRDIELSNNIEFAYGTGKICFTADEPVVVKQTKVGLDLLFVEGKPANIVVDKNVTFDIYDNNSGMYLYYGPSLTLNGAIVGGQNWGCLYLFNGTHFVNKDGRIEVGRVQVAFNTVNVKGTVDTNYLLVEGATFNADGAVVDAAAIHDSNNGGMRWGASTFNFLNGTKVTANTITLKYDASVIKMDATSEIKANNITGTGKIVIDARTVADTEKQVIFADISGFSADNIEVIGGEYQIIDTGVVIRRSTAHAYFDGYYYDTFKDAFDAAVESSMSKVSLSVLGDSTVGTMEIPAGKSIVLDLGGKMLTKADGAKIVVDNAIVKFANGTLFGYSASDVEIKGDSVVTFPAGTVELSAFADTFYKVTNEDDSVSVATVFRSFIQVESGVPCIGYLKNATSEYKVYGKAELTDADWTLVEMDVEEGVVSDNPALPLKWHAPTGDAYRFFKVEKLD